MSRSEQPWMRLYTSALDSHKVQSLKPEHFKFWVNILLLYKRKGEVMPSLPEIAFALRMSERTAADALQVLVTAELVDADGDDYAPHDWDEMQYTSDTSAARTRAYRERRKSVTSDGVVTSQTRHCDVTSDALRRARKTEPDSEEERTEPEAEKNPLTPKGVRRVSEPLPLAPGWLADEAWQSFIQHRKQLKAALTPIGAHRILDKLFEMFQAGQDPRAILAQSEERGWKGIFPIAPNGHGPAGPARTKLDLINQRNDEAAERVAAQFRRERIAQESQQ